MKQFVICLLLFSPLAAMEQNNNTHTCVSSISKEGCDCSQLTPQERIKHFRHFITTINDSMLKIVVRGKRKRYEELQRDFQSCQKIYPDIKDKLSEEEQRIYEKSRDKIAQLLDLYQKHTFTLRDHEKLAINELTLLEFLSNMAE